MPLALKAQFTVTAGIIPGDAMPEYTRVWHYTSADLEHDSNVPPMPEGHKIDMNGPADQPHNTRFTGMLIEANLYATGLVNPRMVNWVRLDWMWM